MYNVHFALEYGQNFLNLLPREEIMIYVLLYFHSVTIINLHPILVDIGNNFTLSV